MRLLDSVDAVTLRLLTEAVDEKANRVEVMAKLSPRDVKLQADLMTLWGIQASLFERASKRVL